MRWIFISGLQIHTKQWFVRYLSLPLKGNVACVEVRGDDGRCESLCCVFLRGLHGCQEGRRITGRQHQWLCIDHLLLMVYLHHHSAIIYEEFQTQMVC